MRLCSSGPIQRMRLTTASATHRSSRKPDHIATSVSSYLAFVEKTKDTWKPDFVFRGQRADKSLIPRVARLIPKARGSLSHFESLALREFKRRMLPFIKYEPKDEWDLIALAQHHRLPTRLLDWSFSALAALWFCVERVPKEDENGEKLDGVVWLLKTLVEDFIQDPSDETETPKSQHRTRIFRPRWITQRIMAQQGVFTCHIETKAGRFVPFESNKFFKNRLLKICIPADSFTKIRDQLDRCGISKASLFPDLEGLAGHLQLRYFREGED